MPGSTGTPLAARRKIAAGVAGLLVIGAIPGAQFGAWTNRRVASQVFRRIFAVLMLVVVVRLVLSR